jgi:hypothetical protein
MKDRGICCQPKDQARVRRSQSPVAAKKGAVIPDQYAWAHLVPTIQGTAPAGLSVRL